jgi:bacterial/archaeal transporter family protein
MDNRGFPLKPKPGLNGAPSLIGSPDPVPPRETTLQPPAEVNYPCGAFMNWLGWAVLSALFAAATALLAKAGVAHVDPNLATAIRTSVVLVFAWTIALALGSHGGLAHVGRRSWLFLIASGMATGLSWICYFRALSMGEASKVAPIDKLSVVFVALLAWPLLGETITLAKAAGVVLIAAGAILMAWA